MKFFNNTPKVPEITFRLPSKLLHRVGTYVQELDKKPILLTSKEDVDRVLKIDKSKIFNKLTKNIEFDKLKGLDSFKFDTPENTYLVTPKKVSPNVLFHELGHAQQSNFGKKTYPNIFKLTPYEREAWDLAPFNKYLDKEIRDYALSTYEKYDKDMNRNNNLFIGGALLLSLFPFLPSRLVKTAEETNPVTVGSLVGLPGAALGAFLGNEINNDRMRRITAFGEAHPKIKKPSIVVPAKEAMKFFLPLFLLGSGATILKNEIEG